MASLETMHRQKTVQLALIRPMTALFQPPRHIAENPAAQEEYLNSLISQLIWFSEDAIKAGWEDLKASLESWTWPKIADVIKAVRSHEKAGSGVRESQSKFPWELREEQTQRLHARYMEQWAQSEPLYVQATAEGWGVALYQWVSGIARSQAEYITSPRGQYSCNFAHWHTDDRPELEREVRAMIHAVKDSGVPRVEVPGWVVIRLSGEKI